MVLQGRKKNLAGREILYEKLAGGGGGCMQGCCVYGEKNQYMLVDAGASMYIIDLFANSLTHILTS